MADIFLSYKSERQAAAQHLCRILELNGYTVWYDYGLLSGQDFSQQIERELRAAKTVIVLWCSKSRDSDWVNNEALLAKRLGKFVPVWIEKIDLPLDFIRDDTIDLSNWNGNSRNHSLDRLWDEIARLSGKEQSPDMRGIRAFESTWRNYGALPLAQFPLEKQLAGLQGGNPPLPQSQLTRARIATSTPYTPNTVSHTPSQTPPLVSTPHQPSPKSIPPKRAMGALATVVAFATLAIVLFVKINTPVDTVHKITELDETPKQTTLDSTDTDSEFAFRLESKLNSLALEIEFMNNRANVGDQSISKLNEIVRLLKINPDEKFKIEIHTDSSGIAAYNQQLSDARAYYVMSHLIENGVEESRLTSEGYGERFPITDNSSIEGRRQNRRLLFRQMQ